MAQGDVIHVLDCFEKDTAKTEKKDLHRAEARLKLVRQRLIEERKEEREKMPNGKPVSKPGHVTKGDIFDDLGLSPEESLEAKIKSDLWKDLVLHIEKRSLDQASLKKILKIHQPDVSNLLKGKISKFSTGKLIQFAVRLNLGVHVQLKEPKPARHVVSNLSAAKAEKKNRQMTAYK